MNQKMSFGVILALSINIGAAIGSATGAMAQCVAFGAGLGVAIGAMVSRKRSV